ncbi:hypothetical protein FB451DRAFT_1257320 [Mycena latifolia]|nr:hypothetical protein FB451DRAFT_1257320 [Mycena latifolia]
MVSVSPLGVLVVPCASSTSIRGTVSSTGRSTLGRRLTALDRASSRLATSSTPRAVISSSTLPRGGFSATGHRIT